MDNQQHPDHEETRTNSPIEWDSRTNDKQWKLGFRQASVQRKHAQHARHLPSRNLASVAEEKRCGIGSTLPYATLRAHRHPMSPTEAHAMNIVSHMEIDDELMLDDPISELLRIEMLRDMPQCLTVKRSIRAKLTMSVNEKKKKKLVGFWKRLKYKISFSFTKINMAMREVASTMEVWYYSIKAIEGHFGSGVATYFKFLRWLFIFNIICCVMSVAFIVLPQSLVQVHSNDAFTGWEILTGTGSFTNSIMYYGFYTNGTVTSGSGPAYSIPLAYLMTMFCCYSFTFVLLSIKVAGSYRKSSIESAGGLINVYASKVFCGWDFGIASYRAANLRSAIIYGELKELLGETRKRLHQGCATRSYVLIIQIAVTALVVSVMSGTGIMLWNLLNRYEVDPNNMLINMVVPLTITIIMNVYPAFFSWLVQFEGYSNKRIALYVTMIRTYVMEVVIIGILLVFWLIYTVQSCWQTEFGQEIYRLIIADFIVSIMGTFTAQMIRSKLYLMAWRKIGAPRFDIARNTLNLTYNQTLFWIAFYFSPLMSVIVIIKFVLIFYLKKYGVLNHCEPPSRSWRAAQTQTLFMALAFLSMVGILISLGYIITSVPSQECGPFRGYKYTWEMIVEGVLQLRRDNQFWVIITTLARPGVGAGILIAMCVAVYYLRAKADARKEMVEILRGMLILGAHDKEFLLSGIAKVADERLLEHNNQIPSQQPSLQTNQGYNSKTSSCGRRYSRLSTGKSETHFSERNSMDITIFPHDFHENDDNSNVELMFRHSILTDVNSTHDPMKSQIASEGVGRTYSFMKQD